MKKKSKKKWKDYAVMVLVISIAIAWVMLIKVGYRLPIARRLSEVIPAWIMILNLVILLVSVALLTYSKNLSEMAKLLNFLIFTVSGILFSMSAKHLPLAVVVGTTVVIFIGLIIRKDKERSKKK